MQESLNRPVALKILQKFDRPAQAVRFFNEGQIVASMNHPNIITTYDIGSVGSQQYIAMEYLDNGSLRDRVKEGVSPAVALDIVQAIGSALEFVHQMGIVHRDIKPENILFHKNGIPKITDFGVAKALDRDMNLTMDGTALGSPYYLSPEQAEGKDLDGRSDIYSLGVILFELLAQRKPYLGESQIEVIFGHMNKPIPSLPDKHLHYQALVEKMMAKDANERFSSVKEMLEYLNTLRNHINSGSNRRTTSPNRRGQSKSSRQRTKKTASSKRLVLVAASVAMIAAVAALVLNRPSPPLVSAGTPTNARTEDISAEPVAMATTGIQEEKAIATQPEQPLMAIPAGESLTTTPEMEAAADAMEEGPLAESAFEALNEGTPFDASTDIDTENGALAASDEPPAGEEETIESLMLKADEALKKYRLTSPKTGSAYYFYNKILKLDPGNKEASLGIKKLAGKYGILADKALKKGDEKKARTYIERGLRIRPRDTTLLARQEHLNELEAARLAPPPPPPPEPVRPPPKPKPEPVNSSLQLLESLE